MLGLTLQVARNELGRRSASDRSTMPRSGYHHSQRRLIEEVPRLRGETLGWIKTANGDGDLRYINRDCNRPWFELTARTCALTRLAKLEAAAE